MVYNYDIYYKTGPKSAQSYRITKTAVPGIIYNGVPDWLYEGLFDEFIDENRMNCVALYLIIHFTNNSLQFYSVTTKTSLSSYPLGPLFP